MSTLAELRDSRELLVNLTLREVRGKYKRTALGPGLVAAQPARHPGDLHARVRRAAASSVPPMGDPSGLDVFALWLAGGLLPWTFFSGGAAAGWARCSEREPGEEGVLPAGGAGQPPVLLASS